jgi:hypothetical protein
MSTIKINVYRDGSTWFGSRWIDDEYDGCDDLDVVDGATEAEAIAAAEAMPLLVGGERIVRRADDIDTAQGIMP